MPYKRTREKSFVEKINIKVQGWSNLALNPFTVFVTRRIKTRIVHHESYFFRRLDSAGKIKQKASGAIALGYLNCRQYKSFVGGSSTTVTGL